MLPKQFEDRYEPEPNTGCWLWTGNLTGRDNRAFVWWEGKTQIASRAVWKLVNGPIPEGKCVLHTCDNPACVNPGHLYIGTHSDNAKDRQVRGRNKAFEGLDVKGSNNGSAKLTVKDVLAIRADTEHAHKTLAKMYGVHEATISLIKRRLRWRHI